MLRVVINIPIPTILFPRLFFNPSGYRQADRLSKSIAREITNCGKRCHYYNTKSFSAKGENDILQEISTF